MSWITGIDVSNNNGTVDWSKVAAAGHKFGWAKATQSNDFKDEYFADNWAGMKANKIVRGAYHYGIAAVDPVAQARFFWATVMAAGYGPGDLPLALDLEDPKGTPTSWVIGFITELHNLSGRTPIIYTGWSYYKGPSLGCPLWLPSYFPTDLAHLGGITPKLPPAWKSWTFWQWEDNAVVPGVHGNCDTNVFAGSYADLLKLAGGFVKPATPLLIARLVKAGFGPKSALQVVKALQNWDGEVLPPNPGDSELFRRLTNAGFGPDNARKIIYALRAN